jgi:hypothetical protein
MAFGEAVMIVQFKRLFALIFAAAAVLSFPAKAEKAATCTLITPPKTPTELLENIKCGVATNIFVDDDIFRDDEKLWKITGGQEFFKKFPVPNHVVLPSFQMDVISVEISHFPMAIDKTTDDKCLFPLKQLNLGITKNIQKLKDNSSTQETVLISLGKGTGLQLNFDDVVKLFGPDWKRVEEVKFYSGANSSGPSSKAANVKRKLIPAYAIQYQLPAPPPVTAGILVHFDNDGYLQDFEINIMGKQS